MLEMYLMRKREHYVRRAVKALFAGRKGHGNSDGVVYRVLRPSALERIIAAAHQRGAEEALELAKRHGS